jgi:DNA helicase HerA-like ATPase
MIFEKIEKTLLGTAGFTRAMSYESNTTKGEPPRPFAPLDIARRENEPFGVDANLISTGRSCVIGSSGSGKSYAVGVICEELCKGAVPFAIVDTEGEYYGLKEKYQMIWVGDDQNCDLAWEGLDMAELAKEAPEIAPLILDLSDVIDPKSKIAEFLTALYDYISGHRTPYLIIVE